MPKLCKVWCADRSVRKSTVADSFNELLQKGREKLGYNKTDAITVVLEVDGTEVEDEDYFQFLPKATKFVFLKSNEAWTHDLGHDTTDDTTDGIASEPLAPDEMQHMLQILRRDITKIVTLQKDELDFLVDLDQVNLAIHLNVSKQEAGRIQDICQRYLDELQDSQEAMELFRLIKSAHQKVHPHSDSPDGSTLVEDSKKESDQLTDSSVGPSRKKVKTTDT